MKRYQIRLTSIEEATAFVKTANQFDCDMDICRGSIIIDAKSIMGIMTLCSDTDLELIIYNNSHDEVLESLSAFLVNQKTA